MSTYKSDFLNVLASRGFIHQVSEPEALDALARTSAITAYIGFDCTAPSLHVGSLLPIMMLYWLQQTGHRPIALMGGGTTRVGDPSGKDESRRILTDKDIAGNLDGIRAIFSKFLKFGDGPGDAVMANNADWLNSLNYIDFLRDVGRHFSVNRMLAFDSVKLRIERQHAIDREVTPDIAQKVDVVERVQPVGIVGHDGVATGGVEFQELVEDGANAFEVFVDCVVGEQAAALVLAGGIADARRAAAHQGDRAVTGLLQPVEQHDRQQ